MTSTEVNIFWMRRDLRLNDNAALFHALKSSTPVQVLFIFDTEILDILPNKEDARVTFIYERLAEIGLILNQNNSSLLIKHGKPIQVWKDLINEFQIKKIFFNTDYEPKTRKRDQEISLLLEKNNISTHSFKDHVCFQADEILKSDGKPYTVFTPYYNQWRKKLDENPVEKYPSETLLSNLNPSKFKFSITLKDLGFDTHIKEIPSMGFSDKLSQYDQWRDFPAKDATSHIGIHLRFGTISIREAITSAITNGAEKWLSELAWRDFYIMILWHFPRTENEAFKTKFNAINWLNNEEDFKKWCTGQTGYPLVDAGMRQLNQTGFMHNRVRMVVASFLTKHLLIDWKWGEVYFASKLLDFELASNVGGWQWAASTGNDAVPYFRIFNPETQFKKFDPNQAYVKRWVPEFGTKKYAQPMVEHIFARKRALNAYVVGAKSSTTSSISTIKSADEF